MNADGMQGARGWRNTTSSNREWNPPRYSRIAGDPFNPTWALVGGLAIIGLGLLAVFQ